MKNIPAVRSACLAAAGLVAAGAFVYGLAFVAFPQVKSRVAYRVPDPRPSPPPPPPPDVSSIWKKPLGDVTVIVPPRRFEGRLAGTTVSSDPAKSQVVVDGPGGQVVVLPGGRFQDARLTDVSPGKATFSYGNASTQLKITRSEK